jgi:hypothetical protein
MKRGNGKKKEKAHHEQAPTRSKVPAWPTRRGRWMVNRVNAINKEIDQPKANVEETGRAATENTSEQNGTNSSAFHAQSREERAEHSAHKTDQERADEPRERHKSMRPEGIDAEKIFSRTQETPQTENREPESQTRVRASVREGRSSSLHFLLHVYLHYTFSVSVIVFSWRDTSTCPFLLFMRPRKNEKNGA